MSNHCVMSFMFINKERERRT